MDAVHGNYAERVLERPARPRIWAYADRLSYAPGETVVLSVNTNGTVFGVEVFRDGAAWRSVLCLEGLAGAWHDTPEDCSVRGCGWPGAVAFVVGDWPSGGYVVRTRVEGDQHDHLILVRGRGAARVVLIAATASWTAYNDWGGSNHYQGFCGPGGDQFSPVLSLHRPLARGFACLPPDAPRAVLRQAPPMGSAPRYPHMEWALAHGYSKKYASSGWASYERHFMAWAEAAGIAVDVISQTDLEQMPGVLEGYACAVMVGHDEYWSWGMRDAVDDWVARGGRVARFAANFLWQIRLEDGGATQVCYKYQARAADPLMTTGPRHLVTEAWEAPEIGRPGSASFGLNATQGLYASWSGCSPRGAKGFPVYRPEHWAFAGTGLYYGDILGAEARVFGYEVDGLAYVIEGGLPRALNPWPGHREFSVLALGLAATIEEGPTIRPGEAFLGREDGEYIAQVLTGRADAAAVEATKRGCGMIVHFHSGRGEVFHAGTCDWVAGLGDPIVDRVTRNVLLRFGACSG